LNLAVDPSFRRQGIARRLLDQVLGSAPGSEWFLEVRESNIAALNLYKELGFQLSGRREDYYRDPHEAAIVMRFFSWYCHDAQSAVGDRLP
jgi:ribosomal-protein-alanine N-acetyltransferase